MKRLYSAINPARSQADKEDWELPRKHGEQLAEAVCAFLAGRRIRKGMGVIAPAYIVGESFQRG